jgi:hypothetical protein
MAYSDYTFAKLKNRFGIEQTEQHLFSKKSIEKRQPSQRLLEDIEEAENMPLMSEKAKSEAVMFPILKELKRNNPNITIYSGYSFNVDMANDLNGAPDFMISARPKIVELQSPIFCLVESKNKTPDEGYAQCAAEMYAARLFNQQNNEPHETIYGAVTNAYEWVFLKLEDNTIIVDKKRYYLNELSLLLGVLQFITNQYKIT